MLKLYLKQMLIEGPSQNRKSLIFPSRHFKRQDFPGMPLFTMSIIFWGHQKAMAPMALSRCEGQ